MFTCWTGSSCAGVPKAYPLWPSAFSLALVWSLLSHMKLAVPRLQLSFSWCTVILLSVFNVLVQEVFTEDTDSLLTLLVNLWLFFGELRPFTFKLYWETLLFPMVLWVIILGDWPILSLLPCLYRGFQGLLFAHDIFPNTLLLPWDVFYPVFFWMPLSSVHSTSLRISCLHSHKFP